MEIEQKKNKILRLILSIVVLILFIVGVTYAFVTFVLTGEKETSIDIDGFTLTYTEAATGITIDNAQAMTDEQGIANGQSFNFSVTGTSETVRIVPYYIYLSLDENNTMDSSNVKFYLNDITKSTTYGPVSISELGIKAPNLEYYLYFNKFNFITANSSVTHEYQLKTWITSNVEDVTTTTNGKTQNTVISAGTFSFKINVGPNNTLIPSNFDYDSATDTYTKVFDYTGGEQELPITVSGYYQLEVWGAQGGAANSYVGGYGGYAVGFVYLNKDEISSLYINVGGQSSRYNGGGYGATESETGRFGSYGGGATHIAKITGTLNSIGYVSAVTNKNVLVVAGGGGGGGSGDYTANGGSGGGVYGVNGGGHTPGAGGTQSAGYQFGTGGNATYWGGGGGGGLYGGRGGQYASGGGGSGYIGNTLLLSSSTLQKHMTCYNCTTSPVTETTTYTISTTLTALATATADRAKTGNGYAKITWIGLVLP